MNKIIKVTDDEILVGTDNGSIIKTERANASWDAKVGDSVEVFSSGNTVVLALDKKYKEKQENKFVKKTVELCQKFLPIFFSCLLVIFLAAFVVICKLPRGSKYVLKSTTIVEYEATITFNNDEMIIKATNFYVGEGEDKYVVNSTKYAIVDGELYEFNELTEEYSKIGEISSTKLTIIYDSYKLNFKENTMTSLRTWSLVLMIVSAVLDLACILVLILTKTGVIKYKKDEINNVLTYVQPQTESQNVVKTTVNVSEEKTEEIPVKIEEVIAEVPTETQEEPEEKKEEKKVIKVKPKDPSDMTIKDMLSKLNGELDDNE